MLQLNILNSQSKFSTTWGWHHGPNMLEEREQLVELYQFAAR